ncbi:hypothetical protein [Fictibacillus sp. FJAT-27399]|uniref:hypothetical protein n=1 Tax=Fictibacillus sp. FJAT-27399 TaxID=1729689 RepID=UPI000785E276|nr:hypothetical protein [Fictibacillus sp. FJAT-27399]
MRKLIKNFIDRNEYLKAQFEAISTNNKLTLRNKTINEMSASSDEVTGSPSPIEIIEKKLEQAACDLKDNLTSLLADAVYYYIVGERYVEKSTQASKLKFKDYLFGK